MKFQLKLGMKLVKKKPYWLNHKYKVHMKKELDTILSARIIV